MKNTQCPNCNKREVCMITKELTKLYSDIQALADKYDYAATASFNVHISCKHFFKEGSGYPKSGENPDFTISHPFPQRGVKGANYHGD